MNHDAGTTVFDSVAMFSNTPFRDRMIGAELRGMLISGVMPDVLEPHLERILQELPIGLLARIVFACPAEEQEIVMNNLVRFGERFGILRIRKWLMTG